MSVFLNSLDDFITPAQACINPFVLNRKEDVPSVPAAKVTLQTDFSKTQFEKIVPKKPDLIKSKASEASKGQKVAAVSLNDCLACSGCVTSAETVLIQEQSYQKLLDRIMSNNKEDLIVVCISPQSVASVTSFLNTGLIEITIYIT
jgi:iron only hydrogenase large subunit-like protein